MRCRRAVPVIDDCDASEMPASGSSSPPPDRAAAPITAMGSPGANHLLQHCKAGAPDEYGAIAETFAPAALQLVTDWIAARAVRTDIPPWTSGGALTRRAVPELD